MYPTEYRYSKEHEWVAMDGDVATIGVTDFAQGELGDIVFVELPEVGSRTKAGESLGTVESVKAVSEIYAPLSGEVVEINSALTDAPETINSDPHEGGWICRIKIASAAELDALMDADGYAKSIQS